MILVETDYIRHHTERRQPRVWGLGADSIHEAYWRSLGVQVIVRGKRTVLQKHAELCLLVEPGQVVLFDIADITDRLAWNGTTVLRLRVAMQSDDHYAERLEFGRDGSVERIRRHYRRATPEAYRVILSRSSRVAESWQRAGSRREAWMIIRRSVPYYRVDHQRCQGMRFDARSVEGARAYLEAVAGAWDDPQRAIDGLEALAPGVIGPHGTQIPESALVIGPAWIGMGPIDPALVAIGPECIFDTAERVTANDVQLRIREIGEIDPRDQGAETNRDPRVTERSPLYPAIKRFFDVVLSASVLLVAAPIMLIIALAILLEDGRPLFFGHRRQTLGGRLFNCWKFRTMRRDADDMKAQLAAMNQCDGPQFFIANDPRVTRVGRVLRRFHLDELPQFWNVLIGDMSVVGPRPSPDSENQFCPAWREMRLSVRPGITGLWQVERTRAPGMDFQEWIRFDTDYVHHLSPLTDARILFKTAYRVIRRSF